jgi:glycosyltransferase involved in cell wall biosynthesis
VDHNLYSPHKAISLGLPKPIFLYAGRLAVEKNIDAFLSLDLPGSKVVVGDGPEGPNLKRRFPDAIFLGNKTSAELAPIYASSDVFVFPSKTDTFGMVLLEALSSGLPVAAFPVMGPIDVVGASGAGALNNDLRLAALEALTIPRDRAHNHALSYTWESCAKQFLDNVAYAHGAAAIGGLGIEAWLNQSDNYVENTLGSTMV